MCCVFEMHPADAAELILQIRREVLSLRSDETETIVDLCDNKLIDILEAME